MNDAHVYSAVDLFAGGGGLSIGLEEAGFSVCAAVELDQHAYETYKANNPYVKAFRQDIRTLSADALRAAAPDNRIDLIAGCPPCQGFTSLTSKYKRDDPRNDLIREMERLVEDIRPKAVMMENVPGLAEKGKPLFDAFRGKLKDLGYEVSYGVLQVADYGVPQFRRRLVLLAGHGFKIDLPAPTHSRDGSDGLPRWRTVRETIGELGAPVSFAEARKKGALNLKKLKWHVVRTLSPENVARIKAAKPGGSWADIPESLRPKCHRNGYKGFSNVYGRMTWDDVSPTITGGCTTLSKGRFGHPTEDRTISLHEAALLQTFPKDFIIETPFMEHACNIIGNALPCDFAAAMARQCKQALDHATSDGERQPTHEARPSEKHHAGTRRAQGVDGVEEKVSASRSGLTG